MNNKKLLLKTIIIAIILTSSALLVPKLLNVTAGKFMMKSLEQTRSSLYGDVPEEKRLLVGFGKRIEHEIDYGTKEGETTVEDYLAAGCTPNHCLNTRDGWQYQNPLMLFNTAALYLTYDKENPDYPDIKVFNLLLKYGANIDKYPYVWASVFCHDNWSIEKSKERYKKNELTKELMEKKIKSYIIDSNRVLKLFLDAGANPNRKGSPIPFDNDKCTVLSEEKIQEYFASPEATTPLYEAIKKGIIWESQVDLLLKYGATLDESCLEAAKLSRDAAMIEKIEQLVEILEKDKKEPHEF